MMSYLNENMPRHIQSFRRGTLRPNSVPDRSIMIASRRRRRKRRRAALTNGVVPNGDSGSVPDEPNWVSQGKAALQQFVDDLQERVAAVEVPSSPSTSVSESSPAAALPNYEAVLSAAPKPKRRLVRGPRGMKQAAANGRTADGPRERTASSTMIASAEKQQRSLEFMTPAQNGAGTSSDRTTPAAPPSTTATKTATPARSTARRSSSSAGPRPPNAYSFDDFTKMFGLPNTSAPPDLSAEIEAAKQNDIDSMEKALIDKAIAEAAAVAYEQGIELPPNTRMPEDFRLWFKTIASKGPWRSRSFQYQDPDKTDLADPELVSKKYHDDHCLAPPDDGKGMPEFAERACCRGFNCEAYAMWNDEIHGKPGEGDRFVCKAYLLPSELYAWKKGDTAYPTEPRMCLLCLRCFTHWMFYVISQSGRPLFRARNHPAGEPDNSIAGSPPIIPPAPPGSRRSALDLDDDELEHDEPTLLDERLFPPNAIINIDTVKVGTSDGYTRAACLSAPSNQRFGICGNVIAFSRANYFYGKKTDEEGGGPCIIQRGLGFQNTSLGDASL